MAHHTTRPTAHSPDPLEAAREVLRRHIADLEDRMTDLKKEHDALSSLIESDHLGSFMRTCTNAIENSRPDLDQALVDVFDRRGPRLRVPQILDALVHELGLAVTPQQVQSKLLDGERFRHRHGWWTYLDGVRNRRLSKRRRRSLEDSVGSELAGGASA